MIGTWYSFLPFPSLSLCGLQNAVQLGDLMMSSGSSLRMILRSFFTLSVSFRSHDLLSSVSMTRRSTDLLLTIPTVGVNGATSRW